MVSEPSTGQTTNLSWLLRGLVDRVPETRSALLLSSDGLVKAAYGVDKDAADHLAAMSSGLYSLARSAGKRFDDGGDVRQIVVELNKSLLFVSAAGHGAYLAVLAGREADVSVLGYEMAIMVKGVRQHLGIPARHSVER